MGSSAGTPVSWTCARIDGSKALISPSSLLPFLQPRPSTPGIAMQGHVRSSKASARMKKQFCAHLWGAIHGVHLQRAHPRTNEEDIQHGAKFRQRGGLYRLLEHVQARIAPAQPILDGFPNLNTTVDSEVLGLEDHHTLYGRGHCGASAGQMPESGSKLMMP